ncbi:NAD(P)-dependent oxidoreductase [Pelosinus propionicus]|uniref:3-hydroxyisobutyrate dehydrogenase n=1 Tax=Pelosinus propionicus DSM 13327 TaxID=1123291 RepID=A0A1I4Q0C1_9FIRM|nr:NAD(P)-dependent oxidoreductase [Pelosinus propionicus]SFM33509.1 3-hydroxyisobutyrate dehydrogenase [Pelosinus propionicus DSM 13327]
MKIGYIGLGLMGGPLARNLIRDGKNVLVYDLSNDAIQQTLAVGTTGSAAASVEDMVDCDVVFTSLPLPSHIKDVMMSENGLLTIMKKGSVYIDVSTIDPSTAEEIEDFARVRGIGFIGCPLGKGPAQAEKAEQPIFAGGDKATFDKVLSVLNIVGAPVHYLGGVKQAYAFKLISNMIGMTNLTVLSEGLRLGERAGIEAKQFQELLVETGANSFQLQVRGPWILNNDFANRFGVSLALKDVRLGCKMADGWGYDARFTKQAKKFYEQAEQSGMGKEDCNAVYKVL